MGAKSASKIKYKGTAYKCDLCGRKFMSLDALKSHQRSLHNLRPEKPRIRQYAKQAKKAEVKEKPIKKTPIIESTAAPSRATRTKATKVLSENSKETPKITNTVEFECPKCFKSFQKYYPALKHIQTFHAIDIKGAKVPPNSPRMIQPERKELCLKCNRKVKSIPTHVCSVVNNTIEEKGVDYSCTACDTTFNNKKLFYTHVMVSHPDGVEGLFFPTNTEFVKWKTEMELQTNTKYVESDKYESKFYYHCSFKDDNLDNSSVNICPSIIVIQEFLKGIQVHFYKCHHKHSTSEYKLLNKFKKYSITSFLKSSDSYYDLTDVKYEEDDMYIQFKTLMESIVLDAAKLNMESLKILVGKALEMTQILTSYDEEAMDDSSRPYNKSAMTDTEITTALEETMAKRKKIDKDDSEPFIKRRKNVDENDIPSPKILNSFSLAFNPLSEDETASRPDKQGLKVKDIALLQNKKELTDDSENVQHIAQNIETSNNTTEPEKSSEANQTLATTENISDTMNNSDSLNNSAKLDLTPSSFNESYAEFLEKNFHVNPEMAIKKRQTQRNIVKTKIGQFKPPSPKKVSFNTSIQETKIKSIVKPKVNSTEKSKIIEKLKMIEKSKTTEKLLENSKLIDKPKKASLEPKPKVDFEYEVKEQEDDCNILILKI